MCGFCSFIYFLRFVVETFLEYLHFQMHGFNLLLGVKAYHLVSSSDFRLK